MAMMTMTTTTTMMMIVVAATAALTLMGRAESADSRTQRWKGRNTASEVSAWLLMQAIVDIGERVMIGICIYRKEE
jgi:hypothetical protein